MSGESVQLSRTAMRAETTGRTDTSGGVASEQDIENTINSIQGLSSTQKRELIDLLKTKGPSKKNLEKIKNFIQTEINKIRNSARLSNDPAKRQELTDTIFSFVVDSINSNTNVNDIISGLTNNYNKEIGIIVDYQTGRITLKEAEQRIDRTNNSREYKREFKQRLRNRDFEGATELVTRRYINLARDFENTGVITTGQRDTFNTHINRTISRLADQGVISRTFAEGLTSRMNELARTPLPGSLAQNNKENSNVSTVDYITSLAWTTIGAKSVGNVIETASSSSYETVNTVLQNTQREVDQMMLKIEQAQQERQTEAAKQEFNQSISRTVRNIRASLEQLEQMAENAKTENSALYTAITDRLSALKQQLSQLESAAANNRLSTENARTRAAAIQRDLNQITAAHASDRSESQENVFDKTLNKLVAEYRQASTTQARRNQLARDMQSVLRAKEAVGRFEAMAENNFNQIKNLPAFAAMRELIGMERDLTIAANIMRRMGETQEAIRLEEMRRRVREEVNTTIARLPGGIPREQRELARLLMGVSPDNIEQINSILTRMSSLDENGKKTTLTRLAGQSAYSMDDITQLLSIAESNPELISQVPGLGESVRKTRQSLQELEQIGAMVNNGTITTAEQLTEAITSIVRDNPKVAALANQVKTTLSAKLS